MIVLCNSDGRQLGYLLNYQARGWHFHKQESRQFPYYGQFKSFWRSSRWHTCRLVQLSETVTLACWCPPHVKQNPTSISLHVAQSCVMILWDFDRTNDQRTFSSRLLKLLTLAWDIMMYLSGDQLENDLRYIWTRTISLMKVEMGSWNEEAFHTFISSLTQWKSARSWARELETHRLW